MTNMIQPRKGEALIPLLARTIAATLNETEAKPTTNVRLVLIHADEAVCNEVHKQLRSCHRREARRRVKTLASVA